MRIIICLFVIINSLSIAKATEWKGIKPLYSTRQDVEKKFGKPNHSMGYLSNEELFDFTYSDGKCKTSKHWKVKKDTVLHILVKPRGLSLLFTDLNLDKTKFKVIQGFLPESFTYINNDEGISYQVNGKYVGYINYFPSEGDKTPRCPSVKTMSEVLGQIKLLNSNRRDIDRLLKNSVKSSGNSYILEDATISFKYSTGNCDFANKWNVPKDIITSFTIRPTKAMYFSDLVIDTAKFKYEYLAYRNEVDGIDYEVGNGHIIDLINSINYYPPSKDKYLLCPRVLK